MRKINLLALSAILASRVYASGSNLFPGPNPSLGRTQQNNHNNAGIPITNSGENNEQYNVRNLGVLYFFENTPQLNRVDVTRHLRGNFVSISFSLDTLGEEGNNLMSRFPRDLLIPSSITSLRDTSFSCPSGRIKTTMVRRLDEEGFTAIRNDIINNWLVTNEIAIKVKTPNIRINSQLRNRIFAFLDRENHMVEFYLRRDIPMAKNSREGMNVLRELLNRVNKGIVLSDLKPFGFFEENAFNALEDITDENGKSLNIDRLRNDEEYCAQTVGSIIPIALNTQSVDVYTYPNDNLCIDNTSNSIIMGITGNNINPDEQRVLDDFLGRRDNEENTEEE